LWREDTCTAWTPGFVDSCSRRPSRFTQATGTSQLTPLMSGVPASLQSLAAPAAADPPSLQTLLDNLLPLEIGLELFELTGPASLPSRNALISNTLGFPRGARRPCLTRSGPTNPR
jgi:hypothetical protein